jgi:hypothetical protein
VRRVGRERRAGLGRPQPAPVTLEQLRADLALAATAAETDGCVTNSSSAAAVTDPRRTTVRNAESWVSVTAMRAAAC